LTTKHETHEMKTTAPKHGLVPPKAGFTLIEILVVIAIIGILAAILVPVAGGAKETALKRRAALEMQSIKVAVMQFQSDHRYMPWPDAVKVGEDKWAKDVATQTPVMELLTGNNPLKKDYLQIPEKSRPADKSLVFVDPWKQPYVIGMDRNMDGAVLVANTDPAWDGQTVMEKVLVYSPGPPGKNKPMKTFDVP
jgi:prepilin-type N-terminal cleavage/methylation domain-containing protein